MCNSQVEDNRKKSFLQFICQITRLPYTEYINRAVNFYMHCSYEPRTLELMKGCRHTPPEWSVVAGMVFGLMGLPTIYLQRS